MEANYERLESETLPFANRASQTTFDVAFFHPHPNPGEHI